MFVFEVCQINWVRGEFGNKSFQRIQLLTNLLIPSNPFFICSKNLCTPNILSSLKFVSLYNLNCVTFAFNKIHPGCLPPWPTRSPTARGREVSVISSQNLKTLPYRGTISKGCRDVSILLCVQHPSKICQFVCWALNICISWSILCDIIVKTCQIVMIFFFKWGWMKSMIGYI